MDLGGCWKRYNYFPEFTKFLFGEFAESIRHRGYLLPRELVLIYVWKNFWKKGLSKVEVEQNEQKVKEATRHIFAVDHSDPKSIGDLLVQIKKLLPSGGSLPLKVASAVLAVALPDKYGIFDARVGNALKISAEDVASCVQAIFRMREIAEEQENITGYTWTTRMVDIALWSLDKYGEC